MKFLKASLLILCLTLTGCASVNSSKAPRIMVCTCSLKNIPYIGEYLSGFSATLMASDWDEPINSVRLNGSMEYDMLSELSGFPINQLTVSLGKSGVEDYLVENLKIPAELIEIVPGHSGCEIVIELTPDNNSLLPQEFWQNTLQDFQDAADETGLITCS